MTLRIDIETPKGQFNAAYAAVGKQMAKAATASMRQVAKTVTTNGRGVIASAGFGPAWRRGLKATAYPASGHKLKTGIVVTHTIRYAGVFLKGARIAGKPLLWLPLPNVPTVAGRQIEAHEYARTVGPLHSIETGGKPMLGAYATVAGRRISVPLYVGIPAVRLTARFAGLLTVFNQAAASVQLVYYDQISRS